MSTVSAALPPRLRQPRRRIHFGYAVAATTGRSGAQGLRARPVQDPPEAGARGASEPAGCGHRFLIRNDDSSGRTLPQSQVARRLVPVTPQAVEKSRATVMRGASPVQALRCEQDDNPKSSVGGSRSASDRHSGSFSTGWPITGPVSKLDGQPMALLQLAIDALWNGCRVGGKGQTATLSGRAVCIARCGLWTWVPPSSVSGAAMSCTRCHLD
jgi:hypothetical protein